MQTQNLIETSATVVTITNLKIGDVYKRLPDANEYGKTLLFGIVQSVMSNGSDSAFTALEFDTGYAKEMTLKVHKAGNDLAIFSAGPYEVSTQMDDLVVKTQAKVNEAQKVLDTAERNLGAVLDQVARIEGGNRLTAADTNVIDAEIESA